MLTSEHHLKWAAAMPAIRPPPAEFQFRIFHPAYRNHHKERSPIRNLFENRSERDRSGHGTGSFHAELVKTQSRSVQANPILLYPPTRLWQKEASTGLHVPGRRRAIDPLS